MSNVKVNGNTYNGVESIKLMKADGSGYAEYKENADVADPLIDKLIANESFGDIIREDAEPCLEWLSGYKVGAISFPYATKIKGGIDRITAENVLLPNVTTVSPTDCGNSGWRPYGFINCNITGVLDLSKLETVMNNAVQFTSSKIGTLKLGSYCPSSNIWNATTITNLLFYNISANQITGNAYFRANPKVTNLYVPAGCVEEIRAKIDDNTITGVTNVYSIDEWED